MNTPLTITHTPHGSGSPYVPSLAERTPQDPSGGDMVTLAFLTTPGQADCVVTLHWTRNGRPQTPIGGRAQLRVHSFDQWLFELGVVEAGDDVTYWLVAEAAGQRVESEQFTFVARHLRRLAGLAAVQERAGQVSMTMLDEHGRPGPRLTLATEPEHGSLIRLVVEQHVAGSATDSEASLSAEECAIAAANGLQLAAAGGELHLRWPGHGLELALRVRWLEEGDGALAAVEFTGDLAAGESLVGFGERYDAVDQRGRALDTIVYEQYKNHGNRSYLPVPYFCSSRGYACLVEGTARVQYDLGRTVPDRWRSRVFADSRRRVAIAWLGGAPLENVRTLTALTGRPQAAPPDWVFGPWMSSNEWNTQARVEQEVRTTQALDIPATALVIEAWSDETTFYTWNGAQYTPRPGEAAPRLEDFTFPAAGPWPDPKGMADRLHAAGIRLVLWQIPALKALEESHSQHDADVDHALARGYVVRRRNGQPYRNPAFWFRDALIPDFTQAEAAAWWLSKRAYLLEQMGIDGFKTDGGEHLQGEDVCAADGRGGSELVNAYPNLYIGAYYRFAQQLRGGDAITFSRAGYSGAGAFPAHWAGDENSTWEAFRRSLHAGLSAALSGVLFWGWDIAGFSEALPSAELYLRAAAMAAFCPIMQYHSEYRAPGEPSKDRTPWNIGARSGDARVVPIYRQFAQLRMKLIPYLRREAAHCVANGEPLLRPLLLDSPDDPVAWQITDQYRLGRDLLVAPVVEEGATLRRLYLPAGQWRDFWSDAQYTGGQWLEVPAPLDRIPVFMRAGAELTAD
jgi:alpha-glucosidase (family GH31 glycosyl hydrolase)